MISFGKGIQKNVTQGFKQLELFNYFTVFPESALSQLGITNSPQERIPDKKANPVLDDQILARFAGMRGVEAVFADIRFPAAVRFNQEEEFVLIQVLPAQIASSSLMKFRGGRSYSADSENSLIISDSLLRRMGRDDFPNVLGEKIEVSTLAFDFSRMNPQNLPSLFRGEALPFSRESYTFEIIGIAERMGFGGPSPLRSDVFISPSAAEGLKKLPFSNLWDLFRSPANRKGYSLVNVKVSSPRFIGPLASEIRKMGFQTFAMIDQFDEISRGFLVMDMVLAVVGMIAIVVASLGIVNTMVMSILERYSEIGIMKAVGASDKDIKKIFFFESGAIGLIGGVFGLVLGWLVSELINQVVNYFLSRQGVPFIQYFSFPWWLCLGAVIFSVSVSLLAGIYPAVRAARVDPVVALRHD